MKTLNYDLVRIAQINYAMNKNMQEREIRAEEYLARNKKRKAEEPSDFQLILSALSVPLSIVAAYFVCCLF